MNNATAATLGVLIAVGLTGAGWFTGRGFVEARSLDRTAVAKGLAERDVTADTAIWPLKFSGADNDLDALLGRLDTQTAAVLEYLTTRGFARSEITVNPPAVTDKLAHNYSTEDVRFRYVAAQVVTVYTKRIDTVLEAIRGLRELTTSGVVFSQNDYEHRTEFLFNGLNDLKPEMVEEATTNARRVAEKFAADSSSRLGKIKSARQGQFSITDRDSNNPHIKKVRVVSTLEYYLVD